MLSLVIIEGRDHLQIRFHIIKYVLAPFSPPLKTVKFNSRNLKKLF